MPVLPPVIGGLDVQVVRTLPEKLYDFAPRGDFRIVEAYVRALRTAKHLVYLENQFLWGPEVTSILAEKLRNPPSDDFRVIGLVPGRANNGEDDTCGQVALLTDADEQGGGGRFLPTTIVALTVRPVDPIYVHAKVGIVDDRWLTIGSANINAHLFYNDAEMNVVVCCDPDLARETRLRLWASHLERDVSAVAGDPAAVFDELWLPIAGKQRERRDRGLATTHRRPELVPKSRRPTCCWDRCSGW